MIEVNLLPGKKKKAPGAGFKLALPDFRALITQVKDPWLIAAVAAWVVVGGGGSALFITTRARLAVLDRQLEVVRADERRFRVVIAEKRKAERLRDSLVAEINIIRSIDADRYVWPHILDQITKALPPYTWLTDVAAATPAAGSPGGPAPASGAAPDTLEEPGVRVSIGGRTVDIQAYTTFLRQLAASPWLTEVTPNQSLTVIEADRPVTAFNVTARFRVADSLYIRTIPLVQSVR